MTWIEQRRRLEKLCEDGFMWSEPVTDVPAIRAALAIIDQQTAALRLAEQILTRVWGRQSNPPAQLVQARAALALVDDKS